MDVKFLLQEVTAFCPYKYPAPAASSSSSYSPPWAARRFPFWNLLDLEGRGFAAVGVEVGGAGASIAGDGVALRVAGVEERTIIKKRGGSRVGVGGILEVAALEMGGQNVNPLSCTLYALAYSHSPFGTTQTAEQGGSAATAVLNAQYKHPDTPKYSVRICWILFRMLGKRPSSCV
ncbi:hypothetical protein JOM56_009472 [Amanita muscaria]